MNSWLTRRSRLVAFGFAALFVVVAPCAADEALTCEQFRIRLDQAIKDMGERVAHPGPLRRGYDGGDAGTRFDWEGVVGLSGTMNCGKTGAFEDFGISIGEAYRTSDDLPIVLKRFMELASASICALSDAAAEDCRALTRTMTQGSLTQFKDSLAKAETMPTGTRDFFIARGVDAELDMTPVGISWSIGPGLSMSMSTVRQRLSPKNADD